MRARGFAAVDAEFAGYRLLAVACGVPGSYRLFQERTAGGTLWRGTGRSATPSQMRSSRG
jgi:hypothetical protein